MATVKQYVDDEYQQITDEFKQIQTCVGMYAGSKGVKGKLHLFKEIFNNALDECSNEGSPANEIGVTLDEKINLLVCTDNGRGIPFDKLIEVSSEKHSGTKFGRKFNKRSTGCNGVGLVVCNALASHFSLTSYRTKETSGDTKYDGYEKNITYNNCVLTDHAPVKQKGKKQHGMSIEFIPSEEFLGEGNLAADDVLDWLRHISYVLPKGVHVKFTNMDTAKNEILYERNIEALTLVDNILYNANDLEFDPITIHSENDTIELEFAFSYDKTKDEDIDSYCNFAYTPDNGYHVVTCKKALEEYFVKTARTLEPDSKYEITPIDCRKGLMLAVNCFYAEVVLGGQHKTSVESKEVETEMKPLIKDAIADYFSSNNTLLNKIIAFLRKTARIRLESLQMRGVKPPKPLTMHDEADINGFFPLENRNHKGYSELFIAEGKSAAGAIKTARNPKFQAVYASRGVIKNADNITFAQMMKSEELQNLVKILGCGIGPQFNINNLRYNKIILLQDGDADGGFIKSLNCNFFARAMPGLIEEGRLYAGVPPLYITDDKTGKKYGIKENAIFDKKEYYSIVDNVIASNVEIALLDENDAVQVLSKRDAVVWLDSNHDYVNIVNNLVDRTACHPVVLEHVCMAMILCPRYDINGSIDEANFIKYLKKHCPEMAYDPETKSINGAYDKETYPIIIDRIFIKMASELIKAIAENPSLMVMYRNRNDKSATYDTATIWQFITSVRGKYAASLDQRFKGLGEIDPELLFYTTLNPKVRRLVRLTMDNPEAACDTFNKLHGKTNAEYRRQLLLTANISDEDIDN